MTQATEWKLCSICFLSFICENMHKAWHIFFWNWHGNLNSMIFDLLTSLQGHKFDPRMEIAFCSARHPRRFECHMTMFDFFDPLCIPAPQSPTPGAWPRRQNKNPVWYVLYLSFVRTHIKFGIKIFEIDFVIDSNWYLTFWSHPKVTSLTLG